MSIETGDIKTFTLITGMEIIGKVTDIKDNFFTVSEAFLVRVDPEFDDNKRQVGIKVAIAPLTPFALSQSKSGGLDIDLYFSSVLLSTNPPDQLTAQYVAQTGGIIAPPPKKIQVM